MNIKITIGPDINLDLVPCITDAPVDYDGFGTFTLVSYGCPVAGSRRDARLVLIRVESLDWQTSRYGSGMNLVNFDVADCGAELANIAVAIYHRMIGHNLPGN